MNSHLSEQQLQDYQDWLAEPGITTPDSPEMVIAFKIALAIDEKPSNVIHALRGQPSFCAKRPDLVKRVEAIVASDPALRFEMEGNVRRTVFV